MLVGEKAGGTLLHPFRDPGSFYLMAPLPSPRVSEFSIGFLESTWQRNEIETGENGLGGFGICFKP